MPDVETSSPEPADVRDIRHAEALPTVSSAAHGRTLAQQLAGAFIVFGVLVAAAFVITAAGYGISWAWLTPEFDRSRLAVRAESAARSAMLEEENALRAYLLTREARFLEPYTRGGAALARANQVLIDNAGSIHGLAAAMISTRLAEERWHERWAKLAADTRPDAIPPSLADGKALFDAYRVEEARFAHALADHSDRLALREHRLIGARVLLQLAVFIAVLFLAMRQHRRLRDSIVGPVAKLLGHIRRIRDGEIVATVDEDAPRELAELGEGLNEVVRALGAAREFAASRDDALRDHSTQLRQILDASREFAESLNLTYVVGAVRESTAAVGGYDRVIVWLMDDEQKHLVDADESPSSSRDSALEMGQGLAGRAAKAGRITFEQRSQMDALTRLVTSAG
jgi:hypothetical protein